MDKTFSAEDIARLQGIFEYLHDPGRIGSALQKNAEGVDPIIRAIKEAADAPSLPDYAPHFPRAANAVATSTIQRLQRCFTQARFWIESGLTRQQLLSLVSPFEEAKADIAQRSGFQESQDENTRRKTELLRQSEIRKRGRPLK